MNTVELENDFDAIKRTSPLKRSISSASVANTFKNKNKASPTSNNASTNSQSDDSEAEGYLYQDESLNNSLFPVHKSLHCDEDEDLSFISGNNTPAFNDLQVSKRESEKTKILHDVINEKETVIRTLTQELCQLKECLERNEVALKEEKNVTKNLSYIQKNLESEIAKLKNCVLEEHENYGKCKELLERQKDDKLKYEVMIEALNQDLETSLREIEIKQELLQESEIEIETLKKDYASLSEFVLVNGEKIAELSVKCDYKKKENLELKNEIKELKVKYHEALDDCERESMTFSRSLNDEIALQSHADFNGEKCNFCHSAFKKTAETSCQSLCIKFKDNFSQTDREQLSFDQVPFDLQLLKFTELEKSVNLNETECYRIKSLTDLIANTYSEQSNKIAELKMHDVESKLTLKNCSGSITELKNYLHDIKSEFDLELERRRNLLLKLRRQGEVDSKDISKSKNLSPLRSDEKFTDSTEMILRMEISPKKDTYKVSNELRDDTRIFKKLSSLWKSQNKNYLIKKNQNSKLTNALTKQKNETFKPKKKIFYSTLIMFFTVLFFLLARVKIYKNHQKLFHVGLTLELNNLINLQTGFNDYDIFYLKIDTIKSYFNGDNGEFENKRNLHRFDLNYFLYKENNEVDSFHEYYTPT
ncbi:hypothetical protein HK099_003706 [Clydaea vesicula]|uniref:Uncharacterized protein n=1 Tax=Clydaea vesicula TaxID=447962 RepID=A0AAD5XYP5_9FUNG|nr:hypothetical protein HK099_003706 [Clydaea vesicula]